MAVTKNKPEFEQYFPSTSSSRFYFKRPKTPNTKIFTAIVKPSLRNKYLTRFYQNLFSTRGERGKGQWERGMAL